MRTDAVQLPGLSSRSILSSRATTSDLSSRATSLSLSSRATTRDPGTLNSWIAGLARNDNRGAQNLRNDIQKQHNSK